MGVCLNRGSLLQILTVISISIFIASCVLGEHDHIWPVNLEVCTKELDVNSMYNIGPSELSQPNHTAYTWIKWD